MNEFYFVSDEMVPCNSDDELDIQCYYKTLKKYTLGK